MDYVEKVNSALKEEGLEQSYDSLEEVVADLEEVRSSYTSKALKYSGLSMSSVGTGFFGDRYSHVLEPVAENTASFSSGDEIGTAVLMTGVGLATVPAYLGLNAKNERDEINQVIEDLENDDFDMSTTDFAYQIIDKL